MHPVEKKSPFTTHSFPNINPVNIAEEGIRVGHCNDHYHFITDKTMPLTPEKGAKTLHLVCFNRTIGETEYVKLLRAEGKRSCQNAPQYLLGLMAAVPEDQMSEELCNKNLVAAELDNKSSVFADRFGDRCFLCVGRYGGYRKLYLIYVHRLWRDYWAFLAEDLVP